MGNHDLIGCTAYYLFKHFNSPNEVNNARLCKITLRFIKLFCYVLFEVWIRYIFDEISKKNIVFLWQIVTGKITENGVTSWSFDLWFSLMKKLWRVARQQMDVVNETALAANQMRRLSAGDMLRSRSTLSAFNHPELERALVEMANALDILHILISIEFQPLPSLEKLMSHNFYK